MSARFRLILAVLGAPSDAGRPVPSDGAAAPGTGSVAAARDVPAAGEPRGVQRFTVGDPGIAGGRHHQSTEMLINGRAWAPPA